MAMQPEYLTKEGLESLERKLAYLREVRREEVAERLKRATEEGGELTENAEYIDAKDEQAFVEGEIVRLSRIIRTAQVIDKAKGSTAQIGSFVTVREEGYDEDEVYHLVGSAEANPREGKVSYTSPFGQALLGAKKGDTVTVEAPDGPIQFKIKKIS